MPATSKPSTHNPRDWLTLIGLGVLMATRWPPVAIPAMWLLLNYWPGRIAARLLRIDRDWDATGRHALCLAMSLATTPLFLHAIWTYSNAALTLQLFLMGLLIVGQGWVTLRDARRANGDHDHLSQLAFAERPLFRVLFLTLVGYLAVCCVLTQWPTVVRGAALPIPLHDYIKHHAVLLSMQSHPLPLRNIFFADGFDSPTYYYHFFYLVPATLRSVCPSVSISLAYGIQQATVAAGLLCVVWLFIKRLTTSNAAALWAVLFMSVIGGLDIVMLALKGAMAITLDAWADPLVRIHNLLTQTVWTPQNMQSLQIAIVGAYLLSRIGWRRAWFVLGPLLMTNMIGAGIWVAMGAAGALLLWTPIAAFRSDVAGRHAREDRSVLRRLGGALGVALLMAVFAGPLLLGFAEMSRRAGKGLSADWPPLHADAWPVLTAPGPLANLIDLPRLLIVEFGALAILPLLLTRRTWRCVWRDPGFSFLLLCAIVAVAGFVTFHSTFTYNDFGHRIMLLTQACAAMLASLAFWREPAQTRGLLPNTWLPRGVWRNLATAGVFVVIAAGSAVGFLQTPIAAIRRWAPPTGPLARLLPERAELALAEAGMTAYLRDETPADAVIQPACDPERVYLAQLTNRRLAVTILDADTMVFYPKDEAAREAALRETRHALAESDDARSAAETLRRHGATHVYVGEIEREQWSPAALAKFGDEAFFEKAYFDSSGAIYRLREPTERVDVSSARTEPPSSK
ncbi:MAG: hypothetical protein KDA32_01475 [Phycisphaerales bacterium]|nr:hypothetical protein [Phycisphaerales bacterium]